MKNRFLLSFVTIFQFFSILLAQKDSIPAERYFTVGFNFGYYGYSPEKIDQVSGEDRMTLPSQTFSKPQITEVYDNYYNPIIFITGDKSFGLNAGYMFRKKNSKSYTQLHFEFQFNSVYTYLSAPWHWLYDGNYWGAFLYNLKYMKYGFAFEKCGYLGQGKHFGNDVYAFYRVGLGQSFHYRHLKMKNEVGYSEYGVEDGTGVILTRIQASSWSILGSAEIGLRYMTTNKLHGVDVGIVAYHPFTRMYTDQYEYFQNYESTGVNHVKIQGTTFIGNVRYAYNIKLPPKQEKKEIDVEEHDLIAEHSVLGRKMEIQKTLSSSRKKLKIKVWDAGDTDGDIISFLINGEIVETNIPLIRKKKTFKVPLNVGTNYLVMHAENLGSIPPNTCSMLVKDGRQKITVKLESGMDYSGAVKIVRKK